MDKMQDKDKKLHFSINVSRVTIEKHGGKKKGIMSGLQARYRARRYANV